MNEVEKTFLVLQKIIQGKIDDNPKAGIIVNKGQKDEVRIRYKDLLERVESLKYHVVDRNSLDRYNTCEYCGYFDQTGYTKNHGRCKCPEPCSNAGRCMGIYDTCWRNTNNKETKK